MAATEEVESLLPPPPPARRLALLLSLSPAPDSEKTSVAARELPLGFSCVVGPCGKSSSLGIVLDGNYVKCQYSETGGNMEEDGIVSKDAWLSLSDIGRRTT